MIDEQTYQSLLPYRAGLNQSVLTNDFCIMPSRNIKLCDNAYIKGTKEKPVDITCGGCIKQRIKEIRARIIEYENAKGITHI